jgi:hypothetical protein
LDLLVTNFYSSSVSVLLGNGNGTFQAQYTYATGTAPYSASVGDLNGDGKLDLVVANLFSHSVGIFFGNGNGTFESQQTLATGLEPNSAVVTDLNGDGKPDIVVAEHNNNTIDVLIGNGNGTFQALRTVAFMPSPTFISAADVNGDGAPDVIGIPALIGEGFVFLGNGNGTFQSPRTFLAGSVDRPVLSILDINGDGKPDVAFANYIYNGTVSILLGNGDGTFQLRQTFTAGHFPTALAGVDVNRDGRIDLAVPNFNDNNVSILLANSNGSFTGQTYTIVPSSDTITGSASVDQITLVQNPDNQHIDWTLNGATAEMAISDPNGLTINGNGSNDVIRLDYTIGTPLPNMLHLNGTFTINGLQGSSPLLNTTMEIGRSTIYISYASPASDPIAAIRQYLQNGYNNGAWNGIPSASPAFPGDITSIPAAQNAAQTTGIGYADSSDGLIAGQPANSIELKYTLYGDTTLTGTVGFNDFTRMTQHWNQTTGGAWDTGDFNYDGSVNSADFTLIARTYNTSLGSQAVAAVSAAAAASPVQSPAPPATTATGKVMPSVQVNPPEHAVHNAPRRRGRRAK